MQYTEQQIEDLSRVQAVNGEHPMTVTVLMAAFSVSFLALVALTLSGVGFALLPESFIALILALILASLLTGVVRYAAASPARQRLAAAGVTLRKERLRLSSEIRAALPEGYGRLEVKGISMSITSNGVGSRGSTSDNLHHFKLDDERNLVHITLTETAAEF